MKKARGQFYTENYEYILNDLPFDTKNADKIIEPFAGKGDLIKWIQKIAKIPLPVEAYDIEPKEENITKRDTLKNPLNYSGSFVITNPPYLARNKSEDKELFDIYQTNDLYKCFISNISRGFCVGGIFILPAGFFFSPRKSDEKIRDDFMSEYKILKVRYFEEKVFPDTSSSVVCFSFQKSQEKLTEQNIDWEILPQRKNKIFCLKKSNKWIIAGDIYNLNISEKIKFSRFVEKPKEKNQTTFMFLNALDAKDKPISLEYKENFIYPAKDCSRTFATLCVSGIELSREKQVKLCEEFNNFLNEKRQEYSSLFLPHYREYSRKRIPFELVYHILGHIILF